MKNQINSILILCHYFDKTYGVSYYAIKYLNCKNSKQIIAMIDAKNVARVADYTIEQDISRKEWYRMRKIFPYAGCSSDEILKFCKENTK